MKAHSFCQFRLLIALCFFLSNAKGQDVNVLSLLEGSISATYSTNLVGRLIDSNPDTYYSFNGVPNEIIYQSSKTYVIKSISFTSSTQIAMRDPKEFELAGSLDGKKWDVLRKVTNLSFSERKQIKTISINSTQPYAFFRLTINVLQSGVSGALAEWQLSGEEKELASSPTDMRANPISYELVKLSWRDRSNDETGFEIQRTTNGVDYVNLVTVEANSTTYTDTTVNSNSFYMYRVSSLKESTRSTYSVSNSVITPNFPKLTSLTKGRAFTYADQYNNSPVGEGVACVFDGDVNTKFLARSSSVWLMVSFEDAYKAEQYSIVSANDAPERDPKNWQIEGSEDAITWTQLDIKVNHVFDKRFQQYFFTIKNPRSYTHYRLRINSNRGGVSLTQLADWSLYGSIAIGSDQITPDKPTDFRLENRAYHHVKLSWRDVANETGYRIQRSEDGGTTYPYTYEIPANNTESYPYSLKPETNYVFKINALHGENVSEPEYVSVKTGRKEFVDRFDNLNLWIFDTPIDVRKVKQIGNVAFYIPNEYNLNDINELYYEFYAQNWEYVFSEYGDKLSDSRLHVMLFPTEEGGGLASIFHYRDAPHYLNMVYIKANKNWFSSRSESGYIYDVMSHELCHIVEGSGGGYNGSMFFPVWGDSKWAEIFQYDIFSGIGSNRAQSWHREYTEGTKPNGGADYPTSSQTSYWYRDFLFPTYNAYGKTDLLRKFWQLQQQHYRIKNGSFIGTSTNPGGRGNLGELIHFWSGAANVDVKPYAVKAFGWNEQYEGWLQQAKIDYPGITYQDAEIDLEFKNICQNGGELSSNYPISNLNNFIDMNNQTYFLIRNNSQKETFELTYNSRSIANVNNYVVAVNENTAPLSWTLFASNDNANWTSIDVQETPDFKSSRCSVSLNNSRAFQYYKFNFEFAESEQIRLNEIELWGVEHMSAPYDLKTMRIDKVTVLIDWSCLMDEIDYFELERAVDGRSFHSIAEINPYEISYIDTLELPGEYFYRVAMLNRNKKKEKIYSNISYINTTVSGINELNLLPGDFFEIAANLNDFPNNRVFVYNLAGLLVDKTHNQTNDLIPYFQHTLKKGVYIVKILLEKGSTQIVSGKLVVQ